MVARRAQGQERAPHRERHDYYRERTESAGGDGQERRAPWVIGQRQEERWDGLDREPQEERAGDREEDADR